MKQRIPKVKKDYFILLGNSLLEAKLELEDALMNQQIEVSPVEDTTQLATHSVSYPMEHMYHLRSLHFTSLEFLFEDRDNYSLILNHSLKAFFNKEVQNLAQLMLQSPRIYKLLDYDDHHKVLLFHTPKDRQDFFLEGHFPFDMS